MYCSIDDERVNRTERVSEHGDLVLLDYDEGGKGERTTKEGGKDH